MPVRKGKKQVNTLVDDKEYEAFFELMLYLSQKYKKLFNQADVIRTLIAFGIKHKDELEMK